MAWIVGFSGSFGSISGGVLGRILDHDVSWYLVATQKWLFEDARLYVNLVALKSIYWILAQPNRSATMAVLPIIVCLFIVHKQINTGTYKSWRFEYLKQNIGQQKSGYRLMVFSLSIGTNFPLALETDANWVSRYPGMWLIPGAVNKIANTNCSGDIQSCAKIQEILDQTRRDIVTDFENGDPDIVVIDNRSVAIIDSSFTFDTFLSQDPRYKPLLSNYRIKDNITKDKLEFFVVMERKPNH